MSAATARVQSWMWVAPSGRRIAPADLAAHVDNASRLLEREGWQPGSFGLTQALDAGVDFRTVGARFVDHQLAVEAGIAFMDYEGWEAAQGRTRSEVVALLARTARTIREQEVAV